MSNRIEKITLLFLGLLMAQPMSLHAETGTAANSAPWYQFEVLVFQRIAPGAGSTEGWALDPGEPSRENAVFLSRGAAIQDNKPIPFRSLPAGERSLGKAWSIMRGSRDYRPLYHFAWRQPVKHPDRAKPVYFSLKQQNSDPMSQNDPPKLEGTVKFGVKRYLHMTSDIVLREAVADETDADGFSYGPRFRSYRMQENRRMRSGKLHYLDHPVLGVLTIAKRYKVPDPVKEEPEQPAEPPPASAVEPQAPPKSATDPQSGT